MPSLRASTPPRIESGSVRVAFTFFLLVAACSPRDAVGPGACCGTPALSAAFLFDPGREFYASPTGVKIVVRPNDYEPGRANIIVYNWAQQSAVSVDVSGILKRGDHYVVQNAEDFCGPLTASGIYTGRPLELPMVGVRPPSPVGIAHGSVSAGHRADLQRVRPHEDKAGPLHTG